MSSGYTSSPSSLIDLPVNASYMQADLDRQAKMVRIDFKRMMHKVLLPHDFERSVSVIIYTAISPLCILITIF